MKKITLVIYTILALVMFSPAISLAQPVEVKGVTSRTVVTRTKETPPKGYDKGYVDTYSAYEFTNQTDIKVIVEAEKWSQNDSGVRMIGATQTFFLNPKETYVWKASEWHSGTTKTSIPVYYSGKLTFKAYKCE